MFVMGRRYSERLAALEQRAMRQLMEVDRHSEVREIVRDLKRRFVPLKDPRKTWTRKLW